MVRPLARWPVFFLVVLLSPAVSLGQQIPSRMVLVPTPMPEGQRITAQDGDRIVIEGDARVQIIRRRAAFVRMIADSDRGFVVLVAEYLTAIGETPGRLTDKAYSFTLPDGQWQWPLPTRWEGPAWLEEDGTSPAVRSQIYAVETSEGTIAFVDTLPDSAAPGPATRVHFRGLNTTAESNRPPFDLAEEQAIATAVRQAPRQPILR